MANSTSTSTKVLSAVYLVAWLVTLVGLVGVWNRAASVDHDGKWQLPGDGVGGDTKYDFSNFLVSKGTLASVWFMLAFDFIVLVVLSVCDKKKALANNASMLIGFLSIQATYYIIAASRFYDLSGGSNWGYDTVVAGSSIRVIANLLLIAVIGGGTERGVML